MGDHYSSELPVGSNSPSPCTNFCLLLLWPLLPWLMLKLMPYMELIIPHTFITPTLTGPVSPDLDSRAPFMEFVERGQLTLMLVFFMVDTMDMASDLSMDTDTVFPELLAMVFVPHPSKPDLP